MTELTVICYIVKGDDVLFIVKNSGLNKDKWLGIGGHMEEGESPYESISREIFEETGIGSGSLADLKQRGFMTFVNTVYPDEHIHVFTAEYKGDISSMPLSCNEGDLRWVDKKDIYDLPIWEGDKEMFRCLFSGDGFFSLKVSYDKDDLIGIERY
ncbi:MAG: NUDIX domain-containing protein [Clostridiales bacterium]|nr:NUDIX domain-containing protein [Clostridiales bacterium]